MDKLPTVTEPDVFSGPCPARELLDRIGDKWTMLIIGVLVASETPVRFTLLRRTINGISQKMLTQTLRQLERDGLVTRRVFPVIPPRVEYEATPLGRTLERPLGALSAWTEKHMTEVSEAQKRFDARNPSEGVA